MHQHRLEEQTRMVEYLKATNAPVSSLGRSVAQNRSPSPVAQNRSECSPGQLTPATADLPIAGHILCTHIHVHARSCTRMHVDADTQIQMDFHMNGCDRVCTVCMRACPSVELYRSVGGCDVHMHGLRICVAGWPGTAVRVGMVR